jgi:hypothetical protein
MTINGDRIRTAITFVHLGRNNAPTLLNMALVAQENNEFAELYLITDAPELWTSFPGTLVSYSIAERSEKFHKFIKRNKELEGISGGYWLYTTERLFALRALKSVIHDDISVIHIESDVFSMLTSQVLNYLTSNFSKTAIPRYSQTRGIASVLFSPNLHVLLNDLDNLETLLFENSRINNDMDLLGLALETKTLDELPSAVRVVDKKFSNQQDQFLFDGLAIGQYLLGQDPLHTNGDILTGFVNPDFGFDLRSGMFEICTDNRNGHLRYIYHGTSYTLANLHVHSKYLTPNIISNKDFWEKIIKSANGSNPITLGEKIPDLIHQSKISTRNKFRRARKIGYFEYAKRVIKNRTSR